MENAGLVLVTLCGPHSCPPLLVKGRRGFSARGFLPSVAPCQSLQTTAGSSEARLDLGVFHPLPLPSLGCVCVGGGGVLLSGVWLFATPWRALLCHEFSRQEYWSGWPFPPPGDLPYPGVEPGSDTLQADSLSLEPPGKPLVFLGGAPHVLLMWECPNPRRESFWSQETSDFSLCCSQHPFYFGITTEQPNSIPHPMNFSCCFCQLFPFNLQVSVFSCPLSNFHSKVKLHSPSP